MSKVKIIAKLQRDFQYLEYMAIRRVNLSQKHYFRNWKKPKPEPPQASPSRPIPTPGNYVPSKRTLKQASISSRNAVLPPIQPV